MIKDRDTLYYIFKIIKSVKKPLVKIYPDGRILGTDESFASLNILVPEVLNYNIDIPYIFRSTEIAAFMRTLSLENGPLVYSPYEIVMGAKNRKSPSAMVPNHLELNFLFDDLYGKVTDTYKKEELYREEAFQSSIPQMFSLKASDGAKMFNVDKGFLMSSFNAIHPANKSDRVDLIIRDHDIYSYIAEFIIYKKKDAYQLHEYLRFRKI